MIVEIVIRHAREDEKLLMEFVSHLKPLERTGRIAIFHEGKIQSGDISSRIIRMHMQRAHIILPLMSRHFVASDAYVEIEQALLRTQQASARIIPIILRAVDWQTGSFSDVKALPENNVPVKSWSDRDYAWTGIVQYLRAVVAEFSQ
ncbi:MAG TPA: toll/interleukin-1 receptor domain-containing protein [Ktedonobacteraceae bacterium]|nr:toll/interleukin-1 receptor domain-containing protein [Ktedonobacteraceae bacterium]